MMKRRLISMILILVMLFSIQTPAYASTLAGRIEKLKKEVASLQSQLSELESTKKSAQATFDKVGAKYKDGMFGFYEWEAKKYPQYAADANRA